MSKLVIGLLELMYDKLFFGFRHRYNCLFGLGFATGGRLAFNARPPRLKSLESELFQSTAFKFSITIPPTPLLNTTASIWRRCVFYSEVNMGNAKKK
jgi:hypothetical protein